MGHDRSKTKLPLQPEPRTACRARFPLEMTKDVVAPSRRTWLHQRRQGRQPGPVLCWRRRRCRLLREQRPTSLFPVGRTDKRYRFRPTPWLALRLANARHRRRMDRTNLRCRYRHYPQHLGYGAENDLFSSEALFVIAIGTCSKNSQPAASAAWCAIDTAAWSPQQLPQAPKRIREAHAFITTNPYRCKSCRGRRL